jgi:hypothetical protein
MWSSEPLRRPAVALAGVLTTIVLVGPALAAIDLAALQVLPQRGQSAEQARRDRYECHNWAIEQTGVIPLAAPLQQESTEDTARARRAERFNRILSGAAIGAGIGGLIRSAQGENPTEGLIAGGAVGGVVGAATGRKKESIVEDDADNEYLRALSACLEGRGYTVSMPTAAAGEPVVAKR